jgi:hypothetical protein
MIVKYIRLKKPLNGAFFMEFSSLKKVSMVGDVYYILSLTLKNILTGIYLYL